MFQLESAQMEKYARVAIEVGLKLRPGQELVITAPIQAVDFVRHATRIAYQAGAKLVTTLYGDDSTALSLYQNASPDSLDYASGWIAEGLATAVANGAARLAVLGDNPTLFKDIDPALLARAGKARGLAYKRLSQLTTGSVSNWSIVAYPTSEWASQVFPGEENALEKLWEVVLKSCRCDNTVVDPVAAWDLHNGALHERSSKMNSSKFDSLHFVGAGTDLVVGLAENNVWEGGAAPTVDGHLYNANIPTEEVFTTPHSRKVNGVAKSTKPLLYRGTLISGIEVTFKDGAAIEVKAETGEQVLRDMIAEDENACRLGEVALVPDNSPISNTGILFCETLFDENASCHIAFGQSYSKCMIDTPEMSAEQRAQALEEWGANTSRIHTDWMIGSKDVAVYGIKNGLSTPIIIEGEWVL